MASADFPEPVGPRITTSSGSALASAFMRAVDRSSRTPGDSFAESQKRQRKNDEGDHQDADDLAALAREQALLQLKLALLRTR